MIEVSRELNVAVVPEVVWTRLAVFGRLAEWSESVNHSSLLTAQLDGVGATRRVQAASMVLVEEITAWEPPRRLAYAIRGLPPVVEEATNDWIVEPSATGSRLVLTAQLTPRQGLAARIATSAVGRRIGAANTALLADLARATEGA